MAAHLFLTLRLTLSPESISSFALSVVDDPDDKQLWLDFWDKDEGIFTSQGDDDFLGRIQLHLSSLPSPNKSGWFEYVPARALLLCPDVMLGSSMCGRVPRSSSRM